VARGNGARKLARRVRIDRLAQGFASLLGRIEFRKPDRELLQQRVGLA
jgi:hypothetical protein